MTSRLSIPGDPVRLGCVKCGLNAEAGVHAGSLGPNSDLVRTAHDS